MLDSSFYHVPFAKMSYLQTPIHTHIFTVTYYEPMDRFKIDSMGQIAAADDEEICHMVATKDCFTLSVMLHTIKDLTAAVFVKTILATLEYCMTAQILMDNVTQFLNEMNEKLMTFMGTEYITILAYSKEENSLSRES